MKQLLIFIFILCLCRASIAQKQDSSGINIDAIKYEPVTGDNYKAFPGATLIVDYYFTHGISYGDRYSYEIVLADSLLMLAFSSPESDSYNYISYQKKVLLTPDQIRSIKSLLTSAHLKQLNKGVPRPDASAHEKEVLIVKYNKINIAGGRFNYILFPNDATQAEINKEKAADRRVTSSIGGNYELVMNLMKKYFTDLPRLLIQASKE